MKKIIKHYPMTDRLIVRGGYKQRLHVKKSFKNFFEFFLQIIIIIQYQNFQYRVP